MTDKGDDELGSRCIWCGEPFSAHVGDWCSEDEDNTVTNTPVDPSMDDHKIIPFRKKDRKP
jgi:hypothetical protein